MGWTTEEKWYDYRRGQYISCLLQKRPRRFWGPPSPLLFSCGSSGRGVKLKTRLHQVPKLRTSGIIPLLPHIPSWSAQRCHILRNMTLGSHCTYFHEIWYLSIFRKSMGNIQLSIKSNKNNGCFTWRSMYNYDNISLNYVQNDRSFR